MLTLVSGLCGVSVVLLEESAESIRVGGSRRRRGGLRWALREDWTGGESARRIHDAEHRIPRDLGGRKRETDWVECL